MTENTCKIDGQIEEIRKLIEESKSDTSKYETRLTELLKKKESLTEDVFTEDVLRTCPSNCYPGLRVEPPTCEGGKYRISYDSRMGSSTVVGSFLTNVISEHNLKITLVKTEGNRTVVTVL